MKVSATKVIVLIFSSLLFFACSKETIDPNITGRIEGQVQNSATGEGIPLASVTTNPGTDAILTNENGEFSFNDVATGSYTVQAEKDNFETKSVRVEVKQDRAATAQILLESDNPPSNDMIDAQIVNFFNTSRNDSSFVEVEYKLDNTSSSTLIASYEVYFKVYTGGPEFFQEVAGDSLDGGESNTGDFAKYIRDLNADSVIVSGIYTSDS